MTLLEALIMRINHYGYDPLDRLIVAAGHQRFYNLSRLATEIQGVLQRSVFQEGDQLMAERRSTGAVVHTTLLTTDLQRSVLQAATSNGQQSFAYNAYGHQSMHSGLFRLLGFNGERDDPVTGHYILGNGYRAFNPVLMRFNSPDSLSPMGAGGINAYAYCMGDPINQVDPSGHIPKSIKWLLRKAGIMKPSLRRKNSFYENGIPKPTDDPKGIKEIISGKKRKMGRLYPGYPKEQARMADAYHSEFLALERLEKRVKRGANDEGTLKLLAMRQKKVSELQVNFSQLYSASSELKGPAEEVSKVRTAR